MMQRLPRTMKLMGLGWYFALSIVGGIVAGLLIDKWLDTAPIFTLVGLFAGLFLAFWGGYLLLMQALGKRGEGTEHTHE